MFNEQNSNNNLKKEKGCFNKYQKIVAMGMFESVLNHKKRILP